MIATPSFASIVVIIIAAPAKGPAANQPIGLPIIGAIIFLCLLTFVSGWMLVRLWFRSAHTPPGQTLMPSWFLRGCGVAGLIAIVALAWAERISLFMAVHGVFVALALLFVRYRRTPPQ
jgi:hypothetical protein